MIKKEIINELQRLGIDASYRQKKAELERMLELAKLANKQVRPSRVYKPQFKDETISKPIFNKRLTLATWPLIGLASFVLLLAFTLLFLLNATFRSNVEFLAGKIGIEIQSEEQNVVEDDSNAEDDNSGPRIFEKNNKTYIVYDYPLIKVNVLYDSACKRDVCNTESFVEQIKSNITPLVKFHYIDYKSSQGQKLIQDYEVSALPVYIFDDHLNKTDNFDKVKHFFSAVADKFILQAEPYKILAGPDLSDAHFKGGNPDETPVSIIEYSSFSCPHCRQAIELIDQIEERNPNQVTVYFKHYNRGGNDLLAAQASECAADQSNFWQMHNKLFSEQENWVGQTEFGFKTLLNRYARELRLDTNQFKKCIDSGDHLDLIKAHTEEAQRLGVENLPTFLLNQDILTGIYPIEKFDEWVKSAIKNAK